MQICDCTLFIESKTKLVARCRKHGILKHNFVMVPPEHPSPVFKTPHHIMGQTEMEKELLFRISSLLLCFE